MLVFECPFNLEVLLESVLQLKYKEDSTKVLMAFDQSSKVNENVPGPLFRVAKFLSNLRGKPLVNVMVNRIAPGVTVPLHQDFLPGTPMQPIQPCIERWHLPLQTNNNSFLNGEHMPLGMFCGPVDYWRHHTVCNLGTTERIHAIFDLDTPTQLGSYS